MEITSELPFLLLLKKRRRRRLIKKDFKETVKLFSKQNLFYTEHAILRGVNSKSTGNRYLNPHNTYISYSFNHSQ